MKKLSNEELLAELEVPFPVDQVLWRVTNTANNRTRGQKPMALTRSGSASRPTWN